MEPHGEEIQNNCAHLCYTYTGGERLVDGQMPSHEIVIIGTAHVSEKSVLEVKRAVNEMRPDIVAVELCPARFKALTGQEEEQDLKISEVLSGGKLYYVLVQGFLAYIQKKIGQEMGVKPGAEMLAAIEAAQYAGARVALVDRDIGVTIQRFWSAMGIIDKVRLVSSLIPVALGWGGEKIDIDNITQDDIVSQMISEFRKISPSAANVLVDERDAYIARNLVQLGREGRVLAVVGAGHKRGIEGHLAHPDRIPAIDELKMAPKSRISFTKVFGALVMVVILVTFGLLLVNSQTSDKILPALGIWFVVTGGLSALGVVLARGHPMSALTALAVAWMTTLHPLLAAGWFAGMMEAKQRKPTVSDLRKLAQADSFDEMMKNRFFKVILVAALANLGAMAGTFLGIYLIWQRLGLINPSEFLGNLTIGV
ncbi:MAG: TraB/GumN family protein [Methanotrichaceae archaeon]|nr:TraB/GumN family protein [Methanotrichaceae archaeon]